jgi:hypothetical protein
MNDDTTRTYRGLGIYPLIYPHRPRGADGARHPDEGFDASVKITRPQQGAAPALSRVFRIPAVKPFDGSGEARLASMSYAERLIDGQIEGISFAAP